MKKVIGLVVCLAVLLGAPRFLLAKERASPHETTSATLGGKKISITYGRPYKKGRDIFGALVPWNEVWRLGADEATTLETEGDITIGNISVPKGSYTLYTIPTGGQWTLIVNKKLKTWGAFKYETALDVGRTPMTIASAAAPLEQLTISIEPQGKAGTLKIAWDKTVATAPITAR